MHPVGALSGGRLEPPNLRSLGRVSHASGVQSPCRMTGSPGGSPRRTNALRVFNRPWGQLPKVWKLSDHRKMASLPVFQMQP